MSGGSFDYLCFATSAEELLTKGHVLTEMGEYLAGLNEAEYPGAAAAARETLRLAALLRIWDAHATAATALLRDVWKAVEWTESADWAPDSIARALVALVEQSTPAAQPEPEPEPEPVKAPERAEPVKYDVTGEARDPEELVWPFPTALRRAREAKGLSARDVAARTGMKPELIRAIEGVGVDLDLDTRVIEVRRYLRAAGLTVVGTVVDTERSS